MTISPTYLFILKKRFFIGSLCGLLEYFCEKKLPQDYPCKSHDHDHQWADLVMAWLLKNKTNVNITLLDLYKSLIVTQYMFMSPPDIGYKQTWYPPDVR